MVRRRGRYRYRLDIESRVSLPAEPASAASARRFLREALDAWGAAGEFTDAAVLLTSELVTNALLHARSAPELTVRLVAGRLRVGVSDDTPVPPTRKHYGREAATGRGLLLVESMASAWGTDTAPGGKVVWFELAAGDEGGSAAYAAARATASADAPEADAVGAPDGSHRRTRPSSPSGSNGPARSRPHLVGCR